MTRSNQAILMIMLLAAAIVAGGCSTRSSDVIVGTWQSDNIKENKLIFYDNGTFDSLYDINGTVHVQYNGSWKSLNNSEYQLVPNIPGHVQVGAFKYMNGKLYNVHYIDYSFSRA